MAEIYNYIPLKPETLKAQEGFIQVLRKHIPTGKIDIVHTQKNLITYDATNLMARSISGQGPSYVNQIAVQYFTDSSGKTDNDDPGLVPDRADHVSTLSSDMSIGVLTLPVLTTTFAGIPSVNSDDVKLIQNSNVVTFFTAIDDDNGTTINNKFMVGAGLLGVTAGQNVLFAHQYIPLIEKLPFYQLLINWSIRFS